MVESWITAIGAQSVPVLGAANLVAALSPVHPDGTVTWSAPASYAATTLLSLESCGANPASRFRRAAVRNGNAQVLERLATTDPNSDIRTEAYERIRNPSQMVSARYVARISAHFSGDLRNPIQIIQNMTDRAALEYVIKHASLDYFQVLAKERLGALER